MKTFDKARYLKSGAWLDDEYLVNPDEGSKRCRCCNTLYYAVEYANSAVFTDGSVPICGYCLNKKNKMYDTAVDMLNELDIYMECDKCGGIKQFASFFKQQDGGNNVKNICSDCA